MKIHYATHQNAHKTICGLELVDTLGYRTFHEFVNGLDKVHKVTCKTCIKSILANASEFVELVNGRLEKKNG